MHDIMFELKLNIFAPYYDTRMNIVQKKRFILPDRAQGLYEHEAWIRVWCRKSTAPFFTPVKGRPSVVR